MREPGTLYAVLAIYFATHVVLRLILPNALELDEGQQLFLAQWLALGYDDQPPFYNWLQYGVVQLLGDTVLALTLLKNAMLFSSYLLIGLAARLTMRNRALEIMAVLGLLTLPQLAFEAQRDLTHTVAAVFASALFIASMFWMLSRGNILAYAATGVAIGIGVLSKYNFVLLPPLLFLAVLFEPGLRRRVLNWRIIVTAVLAAAVIFPHARWFFDNLDAATAETIGKLTDKAAADGVSQVVEGLFSLVIALFATATLTVLIYWISFGRRFHESWTASSPWSRIIGRTFLLIVAALIVLVVFGGMAHVKDRWLTPFFVMLPLYFSLKLDALNQTIGNAPKRFGAIMILAMIAIPLVLFIRVPAAQYLGRYQKLNVPYQPAIADILVSGKHRPSLIMASDMQLAGSICLAVQHIPVVTPGYEHFEKGYRFDPDHPILLVWRNKGEANAALPEAMRRMLSAEVVAGAATPVPQDIAKPYHYGKPGDAYHFQYAWIYPPTP